jgi:YebC/PmpR family DNA-binding regulatory protein
MSGHSKWNNIKRKKGAADAQRGAAFTKIGREIQVAVKNGGPDPEANSRLKDVIAKAKAANMPNDNIQRSIRKAAGAADSENFEEIIYEGYGPGGVAVMSGRLRTTATGRPAMSVTFLTNMAETWAQPLRLLPVSGKGHDYHRPRDLSGRRNSDDGCP